MSGARRLQLPAVALCLAALSGCGQKGALYLPDPAPQAVPAPPATSTAGDPATRRKLPRPPDPATAQ